MTRRTYNVEEKPIEIERTMIDSAFTIQCSLFIHLTIISIASFILSIHCSD